MRRPSTPGDPVARALRAALDAPDAAGQHPSEALLARYLSHDLAGDELERCERHLASCAQCSDEIVAAMAVEDEVAAQSTRIAEPSAQLASRRASSIDHAAELAASAATARRPGSSRRMRSARPRRGRSWLRIAAGLAVVTLAGIAAGGSILVGKLQPVLVDGLAGLLSRDVSGGATSIVLAGGPGLRLGDVAIAEDPRFGEGKFVQVRGATLRVDPGALLRGQVRGDVHLDRPVVHLLRDAQGRWNVDSLAGKGKRIRAGIPDGAAIPDAATAKAAREANERRVRLTSASISDGVLEITDRTGAGSAVTLRNLDLTYASPDPHAPGAIALAGSVGGDAQRIALRGEIGPFEGNGKPRYRFEEVVLQSLPLTEIPGAPADLSGRLTFKGKLASEGSGLETVVMNASGDGDLGLCCGELREHNLTAQLLAALTHHTDGDGATTSADVLARARRVPALASVLALDATPFEDISGAVAIAGGSLTFEGLAMETSLFQASAMGSVSRNGAIEAVGTVALTPAATAAIVELLPETRRLFGAGTKLEVPFSIAGTWPDVHLRVDVRTAIARLMAPLDPRSLRLLPHVRG